MKMVILFTYFTELSVAEQLLVEVARRDETHGLLSFAFYL